MEKLLNSAFKRVMALSRDQKIATLLAVDAALVPLSMLMTFVLFRQLISQSLLQMPWSLLALAIVMTGAAVGLSRILGLSRIKLNAYEQAAIQRTAIYAAGVGAIGFIGLIGLFDGAFFFQTTLLFTMVLLILSVGARIVMRNILVRIYQRGRMRQRVLIYGAGQTGVQLATALGRDDAVMPVGFVDDNPTLQKMMVAGLPVRSPIQMEALIEDLDVDRVVLAMPSISRPKQAQIARRLTEMGCDVSVLPSFAALVGEPDILNKIQPANAADFLNRAGLEPDLESLSLIYKDRSVMITGAGGSIGSELVRQILASAPKRLVLFEISEFALYQLGRELDEMGVAGDVEIELVLGSVLDTKAVRASIDMHSVDVLIHAAAYKHVTLVEKNVRAGLRNNVLGTKNAAEAARDLGVSQFVLVSTDKAVNPNSIMGASKRFAELIVQDLASRAGCGTQFSIVRFGNVLGSSGSVVPLFQEQIARGGPVTLTDNEVTRYFMTLSEAARLVLLTGNFADEGKMFVLDMGEPVKIRKLAEQMIDLAGYTLRSDATPDGDIEIVTIGLQKGEKLHEELVTRPDRLEPTSHPKIRRAAEESLSELEVAGATKALTEALETGTTEEIITVVKRWLKLGELDNEAGLLPDPKAGIWPR